MSDHDDFLDDILGDDEEDESVGKMLNVARGGADPADDDDDMLDDMLASPPQSPVKSHGGDHDHDHDDMLDDLDDLLASPAASPKKSPQKQPEELMTRGSFVPDEIGEMEDMLDAMLDASGNKKGESKEESGSDDEDDSSGALHGNLDDLDLGDFEQVEESDKEEEDKAPVKATKEAEAAQKSPFSPEDSISGLSAFLDDALDENVLAPELPKKVAVAPEVKKPVSTKKPAPKPASIPEKKPASSKPKAPARKVPAPKIRPNVAADKPIGDLPKNKSKKKPLSFLKKTTTKKTTTKTNGDNKKTGSKKGLISTFSSWAKRAPMDTVSTKTPARKPQPRKLFKTTARKKAEPSSSSPSKTPLSSGRSVCSVTSTDIPRSPTLHCGVQFSPFMHAFRAPCDLCVFYLSEEERLMLDATGRHLRVMYTAGGCCRECQVFPRGTDESSVRLCRKCFFNSHRDVYQKFVHEQGILQK
jgi:hypothetical protein